MNYVSIDQNNTPLWDAIPKLAALRGHGFAGVHWIEDVDVAFTRQFAEPGAPPIVAPERVYPNGNSDWGASCFYSNFLGRNAVNPRVLEPWLRAPVATFAKRAGMSVDELYARHASSDNFQVIAPSHCGDHRHRTLGSLSLRELRDPLMELFTHAWGDTRRAFPSPESRARTDAFFSSEEKFLNAFFESGPAAMFTDLCAAWMARHLPGQEAGLATTALAQGPHTLLRAFIRDYETLATLYNRAIAETRPGIAPLNIQKGELPFFAVWNAGRQYRTTLSWQGGALATDNETFPLEDGGPPLGKMRARGLAAVSPKALLLVLHARMDGRALALPWQGSLYMPAARRLEALLAPRLGLVPGPVLRVRHHFLDRMGTLETPVAVPAWLAPFVGADELPARMFVARLREAQHEARAELDAFQTARHDPAPALTRDIVALRHARGESKDTRENASLWQRQKHLQQQHAAATLDRVLNLTHLLGLDYWDSRGAILPHALALGGEAFYRHVLDEAEIFEE